MIKEILNRRSVRDYKADEVADKDILEIIKAGSFAPSAKGVHALQFIVVKNQKTKDEIFDIVGQEFIKEAPALIVPVCDSSKTDFSIQDISVASENMFLQAQTLGLGSVWKNLRPEWIDKVKKLLGIPKGFTVINLIPIGYAQNKINPHSDKEFNKRKIHKEEW